MSLLIKVLMFWENWATLLANSTGAAGLSAMGCHRCMACGGKFEAHDAYEYAAENPDESDSDKSDSDESDSDKSNNSNQFSITHHNEYARWAAALENLRTGITKSTGSLVRSWVITTPVLINID